MKTRRDIASTAAERRRPGRTQRIRAAGIATLLIGAVACSAAPAVATTTLVRGGGPAAGFGGYAAYGGYATAVSQPATASQSAGVVLIETVLPYQNAQAAGTGMVLTATGQVLTNLLSIKEYFEFSLLIAPRPDGGILVKLGFSLRE